MKTIRIRQDDGIQEINYIPPGIRVVHQDFDVEDYNNDVETKTDKDGNKYVETITYSRSDFKVPA